MSATVYELAVACEMASYRESKHYNELKPKDKAKVDKHENHLFSQGWRRLPTSEEYKIDDTHGYYGVAYIRFDEQERAEVIVAHRGTCFDEQGNIIADIEIAKGEAPRILDEAAKPYFMKLIEQYLRHYRIDRITHTGFSLGGFIAGACSVTADSDKIYATTFDAPGIAKLTFNPARSTQICNYVTVPNIVNTAHGHAGVVRQIRSTKFKMTDKTGVAFDLNINDLGFVRPNVEDETLDSSIFMMTSKERMAAWEKRFNQEEIAHEIQMKKMHDSQVAMQALTETLVSHDLGKIIDIMEETGSSDLPFVEVFRWPVAKNKFVYGEEPMVGEVATLNINSNTFLDLFFSFLANTTMVIAQGAKYAVANRLWHMTCREKFGSRETEGVIAIKHRCRDLMVYYSQEQYLDSRAVKENAKQEPSASQPIRLSPMQHQMLLHRKPPRTPDEKPNHSGEVRTLLAPRV